VLFGDKDQPLLVPVRANGTQRWHLPALVGSGWKALHAQTLLQLNAAFPRAGLLPEFRSMEGGHGFFLSQSSFGCPSQTVIQIGRPGPNQTATLLLVSERGDHIALAKVAMVPSADKRLTAESKWLRELEAAPELDDQLPRLLAEGVAPNGRRYLVTTLAPTARTTKAFTPAHAAFLGALGRAGQEVMSFAASPCYEYLENAVDRLVPYLTREERSELHAALHDTRSSLAGWTGPFVIGHGDFIPKNVRLNEERIFVFNWQDARARANPLADALDYFVRPRAITRRGASPAFLAATLRRMEEVAQQLYPEWTWRPRVVSALCLAYLLETVLRCCAASKDLARSQAVTVGYFRLIEQRSAWMAA
jgi:Phosphotransferase enzyme family